MPGFVSKIAETFGSWKTRKKLLAIYVVTGILPMICLSAFLLSNTRDLIVRQHAVQLESENKRIKIVLLDATYVADNISELLFDDKQLKEVIARQYGDRSEVYEAYRGYALMDTYMSNYTEISGMTIYVDNPTMIEYGHYKLATDEIKQTAWYRKAAKSLGGIFWIYDASMNKDGYLCLVRKIPVDYAENMAVLVISVSNNYLKLMINDSDLRSIVALDYGNVIYSDDGYPADKTLGVRVNRNNPQLVETRTENYEGVETLLTVGNLKIPDSSNVLQIVTADKSTYRNVNEVTASISVIVAISLLVPIVIILFFTRSYSRRIVTLRGEMHKVAGGDLNVVDHFGGRDELSDVFADMKTMIACIQELYNEIYNEKLTKEKLAGRQQKMELELLSSQINPHFLFNTLESIRMKAYVNGDRDVAHIIKLLGNSIRHLLEVGQDPVSLTSELESVRMYMDIQKFRFSDKVKYDIDVAEDVDADDYQVLPLLLQPVVENSIVHGLEEKVEDGWVHIRVQRKNGAVQIVVSDNGIGMDEEESEILKQKLNNFDNMQMRESIGLCNVNQRIKLFYGPAYGMNIESRRNGGTVVTLLLPAEGSARP